MAQYKLYVLGPTGMIARGIWLDCGDDDEAIEKASARAGAGETMELWIGERLIRTFDPGPRGDLARA